MAVLLRLLRRRELAEEVLHDVYLRVWDRAGSFDPAKGSAMGWLVLDRPQHRPGPFPAPPARGGRHRGRRRAVETTDPSDLATASAARRALQACLDLLEPEPRRCVVLAYQGGMTYDELAALLGRPVGTVKSWVRRSLLRLRQCLEGQ